MLKLIRELGRDLELRPRASAKAIERAQADVGWVFPSEYIEFLRTTNGAVGMLASGDYVALARVEEIAEFNRGYEITTYCPEVVGFGSNGGGEAFVFKKSDGVIAMLPLIGMSADVLLDVASTFSEFLRRGRPPQWT